MICNTAVKDGLLERNPCDVRSAINPKARKKVKMPATVELHGIADKLGADPRYERFKALVLLAGWCECVSVRSPNCAAGWRANPGRFGTCESDRLDLVLTLNTMCHNVIHDHPPGNARGTVTCPFWAARRTAHRRILRCSATASSSDISPVGGGSGGNSGLIPGAVSNAEPRSSQHQHRVTQQEIKTLVAKPPHGVGIAVAFGTVTAHADPWCPRKHKASPHAISGVRIGPSE